MKQREARRLIVLEWDRWIRSQASESGQASARDSLKFFVELQDTRSTLLDFQARGHDKWRLVYGWLLRERRVHEDIGTRRPSRSRPRRPVAVRVPAPERPR